MRSLRIILRGISDQNIISHIFSRSPAYYDVEVKKLISTGIGEERDFFV